MSNQRKFDYSYLDLVCGINLKTPREENQINNIHYIYKGDFVAVVIAEDESGLYSFGCSYGSFKFIVYDTSLSISNWTFIHIGYMAYLDIYISRHIILVIINKIILLLHPYTLKTLKILLPKQNWNNFTKQSIWNQRFICKILITIINEAESVAPAYGDDPKEHEDHCRYTVKNRGSRRNRKCAFPFRFEGKLFEGICTNITVAQE